MDELVHDFDFSAELKEELLVGFVNSLFDYFDGDGGFVVEVPRTKNLAELALADLRVENVISDHLF